MTWKGSWFGGKNQNRKWSSFVNHQWLEQKTEIYLISFEWKNLYGEVQLAGFDAKHDPKMRGGLGEWICTKAMAREKS